ncbi:hypothetical protein [Sciscionella sediminilitoris]|uniref:hypothetical protein n=1 Tax=Sciscionella sediminilitoris TaxID=1445613 RepID=UPI0004DF17BC|nr:hypothetical protein [Sciscionella sp. SE31]
MRNLIAAAAGAALLATILPAATANADDPPRYKQYYSTFSRGAAKIPYLDTTPYVPQGLAYLPEQDAMVVSYYHDGGGNARIAILDRKTSKQQKILALDDKGHAGTLAESKHYLWVSSTKGSDKQVIRYSKDAIAKAKNGSTIKNSGISHLKASSFMEISGGKLYVGTFNEKTEGTVYRYTLDAKEQPKYDGSSFKVPAKVQGMAITPKNFVWSRSFGRNNDSELTVDARQGPVGKRIVAPNMSEDLAIAKGELYVVYESGAKKYHDADYKVRTVHHGPVAELGG